MTTRDQHNQLDLRPVVAEIAAIIGGTVVPSNHDGETFADHVPMLLPAEGLRLTFRRLCGAKADTMRVSAYDDTIPREINRLRTPPSLPSITVTATREPAALARDVQRRVVEASRAGVAAFRATAAATRDDLSAVAREAEEIRAGFPKVRVALESGNRDATLCGNGADVYLLGRLYPDGGISFDRTGIVPKDKARRILAILSEA